MRNRKEEILYHALFMAQHLSKCDLKDGLVYILLELEMEQHRIGYHYVKSAILLFYKSPLPMLMNGLYEKVAANTDPSATGNQIEKDMRDAIGQSYRDCDPEIWSCYFPINANAKKKKPTNYKFVSRIAAFMELWQACCKEVSYEI